jgi:hypothetical protein
MTAWVIVSFSRRILLHAAVLWDKCKYEVVLEQWFWTGVPRLAGFPRVFQAKSGYIKAAMDTKKSVILNKALLFVTGYYSCIFSN